MYGLLPHFHLFDCAALGMIEGILRVLVDCFSKSLCAQPQAALLTLYDGLNLLLRISGSHIAQTEVGVLHQHPPLQAEAAHPTCWSI